MCAYLVSTSGEQHTFNERQLSACVERFILCTCGFGAGDAGTVERNLFTFFITAEEAFNYPFRR